MRIYLSPFTLLIIYDIHFDMMGTFKALGEPF